MQKKFLTSYLLIFGALLIVMSLSHPTTEKMRGGVVALFAPLWESLGKLKTSVTYSSSNVESSSEQTNGNKLSPQEELHHLQLKNQLLNNQLTYLNGLLNDKQNLYHQLQELKKLGLPVGEISDEKYQSYLQRLKRNAEFKMQVLPARIIFRSFDTWNSSLWINVGEADNILSDHPIIAKNSPVLLGSSIVGVVDYVGKHQARVRLITDSGLTPSVRAARGGEQEIFISENIDFLMNSLTRKKSLPLSASEKEMLMQLLQTTKESLQPMKKSLYLAKGELQGSGKPLKRGHNQLLKGTGFNFDFADEEGEGRDVRSGKLLQDTSSSSLSILKVNDLLVTTGMDGVFPPGLKVGIITKIDLLKEGDYFYELEAKPTAGNLNELSLVFVIPPIGYDKQDQSFAEK